MKYTITSVSYSFIEGEASIAMRISAIFNGREWSLTSSIKGEEALKIWDAWTTTNDQEIIKMVFGM